MRQFAWLLVVLLLLGVAPLAAQTESTPVQLQNGELVTPLGNFRVPAGTDWYVKRLQQPQPVLFYTGLRREPLAAYQIVSVALDITPQSESAVLTQFAQEFLQGFGGALELKFGEAELSRKGTNFELAARVTQGSDRFPAGTPCSACIIFGTTTSLVFVTVGGEREWYLQLQQDPKTLPKSGGPFGRLPGLPDELFRLRLSQLYPDMLQ